MSQKRPKIPESVSQFRPISASQHADECKPLHLDLHFASTGRLFRWPFLVDGARVELAPPGVMVADDGEAVAVLAASGLGVACVASYIADAHIRAGRLVPLLAAYAVEEAPISAVYPDTRRASPAVRAFVAFAAELIPPRPAWDDAARHGAAPP